VLQRRPLRLAGWILEGERVPKDCQMLAKPPPLTRLRLMQNLAFGLVCRYASTRCCFARLLAHPWLFGVPAWLSDTPGL